jgi:MurNAc alpha-1-phosphate uridylyltransferase
LRTAVVLAGGLGTRISSITKDRLPKVLVPVAGRPFLAYKLEELARLGVDQVVLLLGQHAEDVARYVEAGRWGLDVVHRSDGDTLRGTGGAIKQAAHILPDTFWVTYGDTLLDADLTSAEAWARAHSLVAVMAVLDNDDQWEPSNVRLEGDVVASYQKDPPPGSHHHLDYGYLLLPRAAFMARTEDCFDLGAVIQDLISERALGAFGVSERFHDIGTPSALADTERWLAGRQRSHR